MNRKTFPIILLNLVNGIGFTLLIPVLPFIIRDLGYSDAIFGLLLAVYPASQFFASPLLGSLSDYYGRKPILTQLLDQFWGGRSPLQLKKPSAGYYYLSLIRKSLISRRTLKRL